jgi:hypothetical protein
MVVFRTGVFVNNQTLNIELHTLSKNRLAWNIVDEGIDVVSALKKLFCQKKGRDKLGLSPTGRYESGSHQRPHDIHLGFVAVLIKSHYAAGASYPLCVQRIAQKIIDFPKLPAICDGVQ